MIMKCAVNFLKVKINESKSFFFSIFFLPSDLSVDQKTAAQMSLSRVFVALQ
jgi:hypothetical protein